MQAPFRKLLVANRGEIACRIARTCRRLGIEVATVHSEADRNALHVREIGESVLLGGAPASDSYLRIDRVVDAARRVGADAVHPGYGFLSENAAFADALADAGIAFVGPRAQVLRDFGDKAAAKRLAAAAGVPVIPGGAHASSDPRRVAALVAETGFPALLKAAAGGGGKGIRVLTAGSAVDEEIAAAMREGLGAFGDPALLVERYLPAGRHVEVQILGDGEGHVVHLWERECSLQRRHQKVVEEAPALPLPAGMRARLLEAALALGRHVRYRALGTVEFLVSGDAFWFLEVNPRLQVEHPVTEMVTGLDLVELQLRAAAGQGVGSGPGVADAHCAGHAIEVRLYAEDPARDFLPCTGRIDALELPLGMARVETGVAAGDTITPHYDPMVAKLIVHAPSRVEALAAMRTALARTWLSGVGSNLAFLRDLLAAPGVALQIPDTGFIDRFVAGGASARVDRNRGAERTKGVKGAQAAGAAHAADRSSGGRGWPDALAAIAAAAVFREARRPDAPEAPVGDWRSLTGWRLDAGDESELPRWDQYRVRVDASERRARVRWRAADDAFEVRLDDARHVLRFGRGGATDAAPSADAARAVTLEVDGLAHRLSIAVDERRVLVSDGAVTADAQVLPALDADGRAGGAGGASLLAPLMGKVLALRVAAGDTVARDDVLVIIESMKMELKVTAPHDGVVSAVHCVEGANVERGAVLVALSAAAADGGAADAR